MERTIKTSIELYGNPPYALSYLNGKGRRIYWDITSFRPDFSKHLSKEEKYGAMIDFGRENIGDNDIILFPKKITLLGGSKEMFINIR